MKIFFISIFPEIFESFLSTSLINKAKEKSILDFEIINPRDFSKLKHKQVDDIIYGGGDGMLMMAQPVIDAINSAITKIGNNEFQIIFASPSHDIWNQTHAHKFSKSQNLIFVCGRYEGIDYRFEQYFSTKYPNNFHKISMGKFITLGGEMPSMTMTESIVRLIPGVIKEENSRQDESYQISQNMENLEYPQYTRPQEVEGFSVPEVLLNGNHKEIQKRRDSHSA